MSDVSSPNHGKALVRTTKTFLEFKFIPHDSSRRSRRASAPSCTTSCQAYGQMLWGSEASTIECDDHVLWSSQESEFDLVIDESVVKEGALEEEINLGNSEIHASSRDDPERLPYGLALGCITSPPADEQVRTSSRRECCDNVLRNPSVAQEHGANEESSSMNSKMQAREVDCWISIRTKKTFLEFEYVACGDSRQSRRKSEPTCFGIRDAEDDSSVQSCDKALWISDESMCTSEGIASLPETDVSLPTFAEQLCGDTKSESRLKKKSLNKMKRDNQRPCKGKRDRIKRFLLSVFSEVEQNPEGFKLALIEWPPSIVDDTVAKEHFLDLVKAHKAKALEELATKGNMDESASLPLESLH